MAGFESTMLHKVAPQPFGSQLPRESEALCRFRVDYRYWWPSPVSRGESHEDSLQAGPPTIDRRGEQVRNRRERRSWPICAPIVDRVPPRKFSGAKAFGVEKKKKKEKKYRFFNRFEIRYVLVVGRSVERFEMRQIAAWMGFLGRGWKTNRKGRTLMECHGLGIWILIRCEQGNWAEGNFEGSSQEFAHVSSSSSFSFITRIRDINDEREDIYWTSWNSSSIGIQDGIRLALANLPFHRWSKHLVTRKAKDQSQQV